MFTCLELCHECHTDTAGPCCLPVWMMGVGNGIRLNIHIQYYRTTFTQQRESCEVYLFLPQLAFDHQEPTRHK